MYQYHQDKEKEKEQERMDKEKRSGHVLVLPYPAQGHINPMLQFSKRLIARNAKVTFANTVYIANSSFLAKPCNPNSLIDFDTISDGFDQGGISQAPSVDAYVSSLRIMGSQTLANLIKKLDASGNPVDAVVYDGFMPWALDVARDFGVLGVVFFTQSCAVNNVYYHVHRGLVSLPPPDDQSSSSPLSIPGIPLLQSWESPNPRKFFDLIVNQFSNVDQADYVFFNSFHDLEKEVVEWLGKMWKVRTIGPTLPSMYLDKRLVDDKDYGVNLFEPNTGASVDWLKDKPIGSVVYVSFGSMAEVESKQMEEIAWGLKDGNFNFLWVVRASEAAKLPNNFANELNSEKGLIVTWSPQLEILANESVGCFVTHCGFNSVLEGLSLGVPMVAMPQWTDQPINAKYVEQVWGTGVRARPDDKGIVRREVVEWCIREVLEGDKGKEMKKNALNWKNLARQAIDEGGTSDVNIKQFAAELFLRRSTC